MDGAVGVLRGGVERVKPDVHIPNIDNVVPYPGRDDECPVGFNIAGLVHSLFGVTKVESGATLLEAKELVAVVMGFPADFCTWGNRHHRELRVFAGEHDAPKVAVVQSQMLDIVQPVSDRSSTLKTGWGLRP
jgi:hypothetical protein